MTDETTTQVTLMQQIGAFIAEKINRIESRLQRAEAASTANIGTFDDMVVSYNSSVQYDWWIDQVDYNDGSIQHLYVQ